MWLGDVEKAFLQGEQDLTERGGQPLFVQPPHDPILTAAGAFIAPLYELTGSGYGLANAPRVWFKRVLRKMTESNFHQHSLDRCFFIHYSPDHIIDCTVIVHVDDFMAVYSSLFDLTILENMFSWGKTIKVTEDTPCKYRGKEIRLVKEGNKYMYRITQSTFIKNMEGGHLPTGRLQKDARLTPSEMPDFRSVCGSLQWLGGQSRPDVNAIALLCHRGKDTDITDLKKLLEATNTTKETPNDGITFPAVPLDKNSAIVAISDPRSANVNYSSQYGVLVMVCPSQVKEVTTYGISISRRRSSGTWNIHQLLFDRIVHEPTCISWQHCHGPDPGDRRQIFVRLLSLRKPSDQRQEIDDQH